VIFTSAANAVEEIRMPAAIAADFKAIISSSHLYEKILSMEKNLHGRWVGSRPPALD
jgi:hypothetical protein